MSYPGAAASGRDIVAITDERDPRVVAQEAGVTARVFVCRPHGGQIAVEASCPNPGFHNEIALHEHVPLRIGQNWWDNGLEVGECIGEVNRLTEMLVSQIGTRLILRDAGMVDRETGRSLWDGSRFTHDVNG